jgi:hypothetical protein
LTAREADRSEPTNARLQRNTPGTGAVMFTETLVFVRAETD